MLLKSFLKLSCVSLTGALSFSCTPPIQKVSYDSVHDKFADKGQYTIPKQKFGKEYWSLIPSKTQGSEKLVDDLLDESIVGLMALSVNEDHSTVMAWMDADSPVYKRIKSKLPMKDLGSISAWDLLSKDKTKEVIKGYVLYDTKNQESINVATVAAHVYDGVMIDKTCQKKIEHLGYKMLYDASKKTLADCWHEFKDKCSNKGLVLMPAYTSNQRSTAIAYKLMAVNLNKVSNHPENGNNKDLILDVLKWLEPLSPVFGWEQAVGEDAFVQLVSSMGNFMVPYDWAINTPLMSGEYEKRQSGLVKVMNPNKIKYGDAKNYMSFYMSDGDNVQWVLNAFDDSHYFGSPDAGKTKMTFGYPVVNMSMISPDRNLELLAKQDSAVTVAETFGGGYFYADHFGELKDRKSILDKATKMVAAHMRQHRSNVLTLICTDVDSKGAKEAYQSYITNNDELIGIAVIQYTPYAGGNGKIYWFKNSKGYDIPVITVRYSIWNFGTKNNETEGTPAYIASQYNALAKKSKEPTFSATSVHAWSSFTQTNDAKDLLGENAPGGGIHGVGSALLCQEKLDSDIKVVNMEELIWQLRMHTYPDQTKEVLKAYK